MKTSAHALRWFPVMTVWTIALLATVATAFTASPEEESTLTKVGQQVPSFALTTLDGTKFDLEAHRGKVVLINFFATWCGPCIAELPHVEKEIWQKFKDRNLVVIAVGREHENSELIEFKKKNGYTFAIAGDPKREVYGKFASQYIPRTYLVNPEGKIVYQSVGFSGDEFKKLVEAVEKECDRKISQTGQNE